MLNKITSLRSQNFLAILFLLILPYLIFDGKLFLGGDDTRLFYTYPLEFIRNISFFSWHNVSSVGINSSDQYILPFMTLWLILKEIIPSGIAISYFAFSLPLILGLLFFQKAIRELLNLNHKYDLEVFLGSLFYIFSPILIINQMFIFLTAICLIGVIPINIYLFIRYLKTSNFKFVLMAAIATMLLMGILYTLPWVFGFMLPVSLGLIIISFFYSFKQKIFFIRKFIIYFGFMILTQSYWLTTFVSSYFSADSNSFAQKFGSKGFLDTFSPTIITTATGNIFYPLLNLFHRQIAMDFNWKLIDVFKNFYDITFVFNLIFIVVLIGGVLGFRKYYSRENKKIFIFLISTMMILLYLFTVNIGILKDLFLILGKVPGLLMFRNFFDKFALGFVIIYSFATTSCLVVLKKKFPKKYPYIALTFFVVVILNFLPVKSTVNSPLWRTENIYRMINIPNEYLGFMKYINDNIPSTNTILSLPFGTSTYTIIKDEDTNNVYVGISPVKIFSGVNDISGHYSFNYSQEANTIDSIIINKAYDKFNSILYKYNVNYIILTKNIPQEVLNASWLFDKNMLAKQDRNFEIAITGNKLFTSKNGSYELYETKMKNSLIKGNNVYFQKISPVKHKIMIKNLGNKEDLYFNDTYHGEWRLYLDNYPKNDLCKKFEIHDKDKKIYECSPKNILFEKEDLGYVFKKDIFKNSHVPFNNFANQWTIDPEIIKNNYPSNMYKKNSNGSIDIALTLYFVPQDYFYYGMGFSMFSLLLGSIYVYKKRK